MPLRDGSCYVIAEFGSNHLGCNDDALIAIYQAKECGADAIKFQLFRLPDILIDPTQGDPRTELPPEWIPGIASTCHKHGIDFLCTPFAPWAVDALNPHVQMWKIGSFEHSRQDIWNAVRATGKPIVASSGRSNVKADYTLRCVSKYPANSLDYDLSPFGETEGLSDHTISTVLPALAIVLGARIIEKHFRLDQTPTDSPDFPHSLNPRGFAEMVSNIRLAETVCWRQPPATQELMAFPNRREA